MGVELNFRRINGVEKSHYVINSQRCMLWLPQKGLKWERFGTLREAKEDGASNLSGHSKIEKWKKYRDLLA